MLRTVGLTNNKGRLKRKNFMTTDKFLEDQHFDLPCMLYSYASKYAVGATLTPIVKDEKESFDIFLEE